MASILMYSAQVGGVFIQSGRGVPTHISPIGSEYTDMDTAIVYQNIDGIATWVEFLTNASTGATINGNISATTVTTNGLTANTATIQSIFDVNYINFNTNPLVPSPTGGTLFYDSAENALSYKPNSLLNDVTVNIGFENLIEIYNQTGSQINNGQPVTITGATILDDLPTVALAIGAGDDLFQVDGIATHDIPNNSSGFITNFGKVHDISLTGFSIGELVYLSQKEKGKLTSFSDLYVTGRTTELGHVIDNSVNGTLQVEINNESKITKNTASEINIFGINNTSSGVFEFTGITKTSNTTFSVAPAKGWIIDNETDPLKPTAKLVIFSGATNIDSPYRTTNTISYLLLTSGGTLTIQPTVPTPQQRRRNIYLGKIGHPDKLTFSIAFQVTDYMTSPVSQLRDMFIPIPLINNGIYPYPNTGLTMSNTAGELYGLGITYPSSPLNPNTLSISASTPVNFQYRTQTGGTLTTTTLIDPTKWDNGGVLTTVGGGSNSSTNQRIYLLQDGSFRMQYGQFVYSTLADAIANASNESFVTFPNFRDNGILIGILSVNKNATNLTDVNQGKFLLVSKFGESVGAAGGLSTTSLQQAYNNSTSPQIVTNNSLDGLKIKSGTGSDLSPNYVVLNNAGDTTGQWLANGGLSATSVSATTYYGLPKDVFVTGGTFGGNVVTFTNNTGGTFSVTGFTNNTFTGGTINGLTANTVTAGSISATTYYNLPLDIRVTGGTYNAGTATFTNNTGGTFSVTGFKTDDVFITGGTLSSGTATFTNNTGGTFSVTGFNNAFTGLTIGSTPISNGTTNRVLFEKGGLLQESNHFTFNDVSLQLSLGSANTTSGTLLIYGGTTSPAFRFNGASGITSSFGGYMVWQPYRQIDASHIFNIGHASIGNFIWGAGISNDVDLNTQLMRLFRTGNLLIGTGATDSGFRLDVSGTVRLNGDTLINGGLTANTISATTYFNLPKDVFVTGATYSNGTATFTNNTGGTFNVVGFSTPFTGGSISNLTANTISATTYYNLPVDVRVTGGTYSNGTTTFMNNTGGTFSVSGYYTGFTGGVINSLTATSVSATSISALTYNGYVPADNSNVVHITGVETVLGSKTFSPTVLASANVARGTTMTPTLAAIANSDTLIGLDINPTFSAGSYTNVTQYALRVAGNAYFMNNLFVTTGTTSYYNNHIGIINPANNISFRVGSTDYLQMFGNTGNIVLQNGGSYVDAGYRLDVLGKVRLSGDTLINGNLTANTISATTYYNLPKDVFVTGGTFSSGTAVFTNNTGGTFSVSGFSTATGSGTFSGGTVSGGTTFTAGLTANTIVTNTISATTYQNLPPDIYVTGGTYSNGTATFGNTTGGTFNVTGFPTGTTAVTFTQTLPATGWTFTHNLGIEKPMITVYNSSNQVIIPQEITAISSSTLYITFPVPVAGYAIAGGGVVSQQTEEISIITAIIFG